MTPATSSTSRSRPRSTSASSSFWPHDVPVMTNGSGGIVVVVWEGCPTCQLVAPVIEELNQAGVVEVVHREESGAGLDASYHLGVDTVPTIIRGDERVVGWERSAWESFTG